MNKKQMEKALEVNNLSKVYKYFKGLKNPDFSEPLGDMKLYINHYNFIIKNKIFMHDLYNHYSKLWDASLTWMFRYEEVGQKFNNYASFKEAFIESDLDMFFFLQSHKD